MGLELLWTINKIYIRMNFVEVIKWVVLALEVTPGLPAGAEPNAHQFLLSQFNKWGWSNGKRPRKAALT
jgi:hypothetical protein